MREITFFDGLKSITIAFNFSKPKRCLGATRPQHNYNFDFYSDPVKNTTREMKSICAHIGEIIAHIREIETLRNVAKTTNKNKYLPKSPLSTYR